MRAQRQKETAFLKEVILYADTAERHKLEERIAQDQGNERCARRAVGLLVLLAALAPAGFCYSALLLDDSPQNRSHIIIKISSALGLGSLISLPVFLGFWRTYRKDLAEDREECRRLAAKLLQSRLGKGSDLTS